MGLVDGMDLEKVQKQKMKMLNRVSFCDLQNSLPIITLDNVLVIVPDIKNS